MNRLLEAMAQALPPSQLRMRLLLPYEKAALAAEIRESGKIFSEEYTPDGLLLDALVSTRISWKLEDFQADG